MTQNYYCFYVDHSFHSARQIGLAHEEVVMDLVKSDRTMALATCQRIEIYSMDPCNPLAHFDLPFRTITGRQDILSRLVGITSGIESEILGEKNIWFQVNAVCARLSVTNLLKPLVQEALKLGKQIRDAHDFWTTSDYERIALDVLLANRPEKEKSIPLSLVVVGSGMLARNFITAAAEVGYRDLAFITRSPRNLRKNLPSAYKQAVTRVEDLAKRCLAAYHSVVATNEIDAVYAKTLAPVLEAPICRGVFDLSVVPVFGSGCNDVFYADMYSDACQREIQKHNVQHYKIAERVRDVILKTGYGLG